ncbi:hypothetical protein [Streptomyces doebereineriae]|uniref:Uncharacterized protein n=1 Tax=Streptomyces doebereineriae TaxID=3075528 RepID=A0ABU2VG85_9ACTN|nr:hypothetical protein [Streptomyces sp. DSM 41640]MDT0484394.1 hypothetical protein [Streptomyces sp. DSM 41640]
MTGINGTVRTEIQRTFDVYADADTAAVLATLPLSFRPATADRVPVRALSGSRGWVDAAAAAVQDGVAGLVVRHPAPADPADVVALAELAGKHGTAVVLDSPWAGTPMAAQAAEALRDTVDADPASAIECRLTLPTDHDLGQALLDQLALLRVLGSPADEVRTHLRTERGVLATATVGGRTGLLGTVLTDALAPTASLRLIGAGRAVHLQIPSWRTARPAVLTVTSPDGSHTWPTHYESPQRAAWRRLHRLLSVSEAQGFEAAATADLHALAADLLTMGRATTHREGSP